MSTHTPPFDSEPIRRVGYIGLGIMGAPMASNLIRAGFEVTVWNRTARRCEPLIELGAHHAESPQEVARTSQAVCVNVTDTPDVESVLFADNGIVHGAQPGLIVIDHSTINPVAARSFAHKLAEHGVTLLDAPVSGGDVGAKAGTLSIMIGGPSEAVSRAMPIFQAVGKNIVHVGESGSGQACKACNQIAVVCNLTGVCEAIALARKLGLDVARMIEVVGAGAGGSWQLSNLGPKILAEDFDPGFAVDMVLKDLRILEELSDKLGVDLRGTRLAYDNFKRVAQAGGGGLGTQAMIKAIDDAT
ncbi:MAG: NAD(P)-dependent oxidoreductase [Phycisphaeraceae bacterium]